MKMSGKTYFLILGILSFIISCSTSNRPPIQPKEIIDLGALITEDLPEQVWGKATLSALGFTRPNSFDVIEWEYETKNGIVYGSNAYYTIFNHGGPHVDAPNHVGVGQGLDSYPVEEFLGPLKVFDVQTYPNGRSIPLDVFKGKASAGDIVITYTNYTPPKTDEAFPETVTLTHEAAEYLASLPIRAFGTDAFSVLAVEDTSLVEAETVTASAVPIHHSFLSRGIPIYEQLLNVDELLDKNDMYFVGVPLNIKNGDGMIVRPVVLVY